MWHNFFENPNYDFFSLEPIKGTAQLGKGAIIAQRLWKTQRLWVSDGNISWTGFRWVGSQIFSNSKEFSVVNLHFLCSSKSNDIVAVEGMKIMVYDLVGNDQWRLYSPGEKLPELGKIRNV